MMLIVYIVEWTDERGELCERWFSFEHLAKDFAKQVRGVVIEKDVS